MTEPINNFYIARQRDGKQVGEAIPATSYDPQAGDAQFLTPKPAPTPAAPAPAKG